jgi:hypothetical protein
MRLLLLRGRWRGHRAIARAARPRERPPASSAAVTWANPHSNQGGKSNFGQSNGQSNQSGGGKQPYKPGTGRYAPRTGDHNHGGDRRSQPSRSRSDEPTCSSKSDAHLWVEDSGDEELLLAHHYKLCACRLDPEPHAPAPGNA